MQNFDMKMTVGSSAFLLTLVLLVGWGSPSQVDPVGPHTHFKRGTLDEVPAPSPAPEVLDEKEKKVMCSYLLYGAKHSVCGPPPMEDVKKKCEEKGSAEHGEKITCQCTDDPNYIRDTCG